MKLLLFCSTEAVKRESRAHLILNRFSTLFTCPRNTALEKATDRIQIRKRKSSSTDYTYDSSKHSKSFLVYFGNDAEKNNNLEDLHGILSMEIKGCADFPTKLK